MKRLFVWLGRNGTDLAHDAAGLVGAGMISYGAGQIYWPAAWIAGGILLIAGVVLSARGR